MKTQKVEAGDAGAEMSKVRGTGQRNPENGNSTNCTRRRFLQGTAVAAGGGWVLVNTLGADAARAFAASPHASYLTGDRIAATPTFLYRPYRSKRVGAADTPTWVQIDLGARHSIDSVKLYPANQKTTPGYDGYFVGEEFPVRFKIESSNTADFTSPTTIVDLTEEDFPNPGDGILQFPAKQVSARYVRVTVTRLQQLLGESRESPARTQQGMWGGGIYYFALSKIGVISGSRDVALGQPVIGDPVYSVTKDLMQLTRPERIETEFVRRDYPNQVTSPSTWKKVEYQARAPLSGVTLDGGLFEKVMRNNIGYLLDSFTLDDLLLQFRQRAGKPIPPSSHKPNQFWEQDLAGSNAGRFLMGAGHTLRWIDDPQLKDRMNAVVEGIAECAQPDGDIMAFPVDTIYNTERGGYTRAWVTHGLICAGYAGNQKAFQLLRGHFDWFNQQASYLPDLMRSCVQGGQGMIADTSIYLTPVGKPADMQVIQRYFLEEKWLGELAKMNKEMIWQYPYDRPHCYLLTNLSAYMDVYLATGDPRWYDGVKAAWEMYHEHWEQVGGSISIIEYQYDPPDSNSLTQELGENCGTSFWAFLSQKFQLLHPEEERYMAEIEKSIYNVSIAHQDGSYGIRYHTNLVGHMEKATRINTCCEGQGTRLLGSLPEHIYSIAPDGIYVNLFEPSTIAWKHQDSEAKLRMETKFPTGNDVKLTMVSAPSSRMKVHVRIPSWATGAVKVTVNQEHAVSGDPGSYLALDRTWSPGDVVSFTLPMDFKVILYTGVSQFPGRKRYAITYGPFLLAAKGPSNAEIGVTKGGRAEDLTRQLQPIDGKPMHFKVAGNPDIEYMPYWQIDKEEFTCFPVINAGSPKSAA